MGCSKSEGCSRGGCSGCCKSSGLDGFETGINTIVELEIHYSETEEPDYAFESLYCLTNIQTREEIITGLEGRKFHDLDEMRKHIMDCLLRTDDISCRSIKNIDFSYVKDDI